MTTLPPQRHLFDIPDSVTYFNCAYNSPLLNASRDRLLAGVVEKSQPWRRTVGSFFEDAETIRRLAAGLFGGDAEGYAVVPAASYGLSTAARAIEPGLRPGDRIVVMAAEFPSNVLPWRRVAAETGAVIDTVSAPSDGDWGRAILAAIDRRAKVLALSTCHWTNGAMIDLVPIGAACRSVGAALVVDATQSLGAVPFALDAVQPDFLAAAGYKWLLCPYGFGLLYVGERWRDARPLEETWLARSNAEDFTRLAEYSDAYLPGTRRFDVGEKCVPTLLPGAIAALEQIAAWGVDNIAATLAAINGRIAAELETLGFRLPAPGQRGPHILGASLPAGQRGNPVARLRERDVYISQRGETLRFAPHLHVTPADVDRLTMELRRAFGA